MKIDIERVSPSIAAREIKKLLGNEERRWFTVANALRRKGRALADNALSTMTLTLIDGDHHLPRLCEELDRADHYILIADYLEDS